MVVGKFKKPAESADQLLDRLIARGLLVSDRSAALAYLRYVGGYRLKGFWFQLTDPVSKQFRASTAFEDIVQRYEFDRQLRNLTFDEIGRIEIAIRCAISDRLSHQYGPHWFIKPEIFVQRADFGFGSMVKIIEDSVMRSKAPFIVHYRQRYDDPCLPPSWGVTECVSFGFWSRTYKILRDHNERKSISMKFDVEEPVVFESWLHSLSYLRNMICHHARLLGAKFVIAPSRYAKRNIRFSDPQSFHAHATIMNFLMKRTGMPSDWKADLHALFSRFPTVNPRDIGFIQGWQTKGGW